MRRPRWCRHEPPAGVRLIHRQIHECSAGPGYVGRYGRIAATCLAFEDTCCRKHLGSVAYGRDRFVRVGKVAHDLENTRIQTNVLGGATARNYKCVIALGLNLVEGSIQPKIMTAFLAVGLVSFEIMDRGSDNITGSFIRTDCI